jgi:ABC-2 type transport system permease protein
MGNVLAIAGREWRAYFASPIAYIVTGLFAALYGAFFVLYLFIFVEQGIRMGAMGMGGPVNVNQMMLRPLLGNMAVVMLFMLPMLTMRTYAEEKRSGTFELLLTSPLTDTQIVLGKFLGAIAVFALMLLVSGLNLVLLFVWGEPEWKQIATSYAGLFLMGASFISLGLFLSSLTRSQVVAGAATFAIALLLWIVSWFGENTGELGRTLTSFLSVIEHYEDFSKGVVDTKHLAYYLSFIAFGLFLTVRSVDSERWRG